MDVSLSKPPFSCFLSDNLSGSVELSKSPHLADRKCQAFKPSLEAAWALDVSRTGRGWHPRRKCGACPGRVLPPLSPFPPQGQMGRPQALSASPETLFSAQTSISWLQGYTETLLTSWKGQVPRFMDNVPFILLRRKKKIYIRDKGQGQECLQETINLRLKKDIQVLLSFFFKTIHKN